MAVYQYFLGVVPKEGIELIHGKIPNSIRVSTVTGYFESDAKTYWHKIQKDAQDYVIEIDKFISKSKWGNDRTSYNWKTTKTEIIDNDASIYLDKNTLKIEDFFFRTDLREMKLIFLKNMIELGKEFNWLFMDRSGKLLNPNFKEIIVSVKESNAYRYLKDPLTFLENISRNEI